MTLTLPHRLQPSGPPLAGGGSGGGAILESQNYTTNTTGDESPPPRIPFSVGDPLTDGDFGPVLALTAEAAAAPAFGVGFAYRARAALPVLAPTEFNALLLAVFEADVTTGGVGAPVWVFAGDSALVQHNVASVADAPTGGTRDKTLITVLPATRLVVGPDALNTVLFRVRYMNISPGEDSPDVFPDAPPLTGPVVPGACSFVVERLSA